LVYSSFPHPGLVPQVPVQVIAIMPGLLVSWIYAPYHALIFLSLPSPSWHKLARGYTGMATWALPALPLFSLLPSSYRITTPHRMAHTTPPAIPHLYATHLPHHAHACHHAHAPHLLTWVGTTPSSSHLRAASRTGRTVRRARAAPGMARDGAAHGTGAAAFFYYQLLSSTYLPTAPRPPRTTLPCRVRATRAHHYYHRHRHRGGLLRFCRQYLRYLPCPLCCLCNYYLRTPRACTAPRACCCDTH